MYIVKPITATDNYENVSVELFTENYGKDFEGNEIRLEDKSIGHFSKAQLTAENKYLEEEKSRIDEAIAENNKKIQAIDLAFSQE